MDQNFKYKTFRFFLITNLCLKMLATVFDGISRVPFPHLFQEQLYMLSIVLEFNFTC